jgi:hypothetical protein
MRRILFFIIFVDGIAKVLAVNLLRAKAHTWEISSHESWQWSYLENE